MTTDVAPPDYRTMLPPLIEENYGQWLYHEILEPGLLRHVSETGAEIYTLRVASPRLVSIDFISWCPNASGTWAILNAAKNLR